MYAGDEFYPDDVTSGPIEEPDACPVIVEGDWERDHWTPVLCGKPATDGDDRCAEHALA
jgi:hypothetical protein